MRVVIVLVANDRCAVRKALESGIDKVVRNVHPTTEIAWMVVWWRE